MLPDFKKTQGSMRYRPQITNHVTDAGSFMLIVVKYKQHKLTLLN